MIRNILINILLIISIAIASTTYSIYSSIIINKSSYTINHSWFSDLYIIDLKEQITSDYEGYEALADLIKDLPEGTTVIFRLHSFGGDVAAMQLLLNALDVTKAHTIGEINGPSYSAGAVIACHLNEIQLAPNSYLMFHNPRTSLGVIPPGVFRTVINQSLEACVNNNILTRQEVDDLNTTTEDKELYYFHTIKK